MDKKTKLLCLMMISFLIMQYLYFLVVAGYKGRYADFTDFKLFGRLAFNITEIKPDTPEGEIYKLLTDQAYAVFFPLFYLSLIPLFKMGYSNASLIWLLFNQIIFLISLYLLIKTIKSRLSLLDFSLIIFILANFLPIKFNILTGQTYFLALLSLSGCLYYLEQKKDFLATIFLALGILLKWIPVFFLILLIWKKRYRCALSSILIVIIMLLVSFLRLGLKFHYVQFFQVIPACLSSAKGCIVNHSLFTVFQMLFRRDLRATEGIVHLPILADALGLIAILIFIFLTLRIIFQQGRKTSKIFPFEFAFFICLLLLVSTWVQIYHLVWAIIPFLIIFLNIEKIKSGVWIFIVSFILLGLEYWPDGLGFTHQGLGVIFLSGRPLGLVLLWIGYFNLFKKSAITYE